MQAVETSTTPHMPDDVLPCEFRNRATLNVSEVSDITGIGVQALYLWIRQGRIDAVPMGTRRLIPRREAVRLVTEGVAPLEVA